MHHLFGLVVMFHIYDDISLQKKTFISYYQSTFAVTILYNFANTIEGNRGDCTDVFIDFLVRDGFDPFLIGMNKKGRYIRWGLGVECNCFYSSRFTVRKPAITLVGYQKILDPQSSIRYSVVKQNWWGKTAVYGQSVISGNYESPNGFKVVITNIPNGENYRIQVDSKCNMSRGKFEIISE